MQKKISTLLLFIGVGCGLLSAGNNYGYTTTIRDNMIGSWLNAYYTPTEYGHKISGGFWSEAENMEILLDAYEATGDLSYKTRFYSAGFFSTSTTFLFFRNHSVMSFTRPSANRFIMRWLVVALSKAPSSAM